MPSSYVESRRAKDGSKRYRAVVQWSAGGRRRKTRGPWCPYQKKADAQAKKLLSDSYDARLEVGQPPQSTWSGFVAAFLASRARRREPRTIYNAKKALEAFGAALKDPPPQTITRGSLRAFEDWFLAHEYKRGPKGKARRYGVNHLLIHLRALKAAFRWAKRERMMTEDPFDGFEMPAAVDVRRYLTGPELLMLLGHLPPVSRRAAICVLQTGLRLGEVLRADWRGMEPPAAAAGRSSWVLTVERSKVRRAERASKVTTKTLAIDPLALSVMGEPQSSGPIFPVRRDLLQSHLRKAREKAGLGRVRWHDMRHTWATDLMSIVKDEYALMTVGGWTSRQAVAIYQHGTAARRDATLMLSRDDLRNLVPPKEPPTGLSVSGDLSKKTKKKSV